MFGGNVQNRSKSLVILVGNGDGNGKVVVALKHAPIRAMMCPPRMKI